MVTADNSISIAIDRRCEHIIGIAENTIRASRAGKAQRIYIPGDGVLETVIAQRVTQARDRVSKGTIAQRVRLARNGVVIGRIAQAVRLAREALLSESLPSALE